MQLPPDWSEFLAAFRRHGVRFLLVGAHALAAHGRPRATQDLDVLVAPTPANARRVIAALVDFGFAGFAGDWQWFTKPYRVTMLGRIPYRIDVLTGISGVSFATAWKHRVVISTDAGRLAVLGIEQLRANKIAAGRPKDLADVALLDELKLATSKRRRPSPKATTARRAPSAPRARAPKRRQ